MSAHRGDPCRKGHRSPDRIPKTLAGKEILPSQATETRDANSKPAAAAPPYERFVRRGGDPISAGPQDPAQSEKRKKVAIGSDRGDHSMPWETLPCIGGNITVRGEFRPGKSKLRFVLRS